MASTSTTSTEMKVVRLPILDNLVQREIPKLQLRLKPRTPNYMVEEKSETNLLIKQHGFELRIKNHNERLWLMFSAYGRTAAVVEMLIGIKLMLKLEANHHCHKKPDRKAEKLRDAESIIGVITSHKGIMQKFEQEIRDKFVDELGSVNPEIGSWWDATVAYLDNYENELYKFIKTKCLEPVKKPVPNDDEGWWDDDD